jgi:uncharacterized protein
VLATLAAALALTFPTGHAVVHTPAKTFTIRVEVASTYPQWVRGLSGRPSLQRNRGMAFLFGTPHHGTFWMKGMRFPLSIAFWGRDGRILRMFDMPVCGSRCAVYNPRVTFFGALEVNKGAFRRWGVRRGDVVEIER